MYSLFGDSDFTARLAPALMGTSMVAMPYFLRRQLGRIAAFTAAVLLAIGPSYLYFSRFAREDIYFAAISFALLVVVFRFLDAPRRWHPALIGALIALGFATKETMYIAGFVAFTFFAILLLREGRGGPTRSGPALGRLGGVGVGARGLRGDLHADVHGLPDQPSGAVGRALREHRLLDRPARRRPRRREALLLRRRPARRGVAGAAARRGRDVRRRSASRRSCAPSSCGRSRSRWRSTRGRARSSRGSSCTRCCR